MIRLLAALSLLFLSCLLASRAEAIPFSFGASINTLGFTESEGRVLSTFNIGLLGVLPDDRPLLLTLPPDPVSSQGNVVFDMSAVVIGNLSLLLQNADGAVLGGYRFFRLGGENSNAQYVVCAGPDNCVSRFGNAFTSPPNPGGSGPFAWPGPSCPFGPLSCGTLEDSVPSCPFGPPFCVTQGLDFSSLVIPSVGGGLMATLDFSARSFCFGSPCPSNSGVTFTLDALALEPVPEPSTLLLLSTTAAGLGFLARRRRRQPAAS